MTIPLAKYLPFKSVRDIYDHANTKIHPDGVRSLNLTYDGGGSYKFCTSL